MLWALLEFAIGIVAVFGFFYGYAFIRGPEYIAAVNAALFGDKQT